MPVKLDGPALKELYYRAAWGQSDLREKLRGFKPSIAGFLKLAEQAAAWGDARWRGLALAEAGYRTGRSAEYEPGENLLLQALEILAPAIHLQGQALCRKYLSFIRVMQGRYSDALEESEASIGLYRSLNDHEALAAGINNKGNVLLRMGQNQEARECFYTALEHNQKVGNIFLESAALNNLAMAYVRIKQYQKALDYQLKAVLLRERLNDLVSLSSGLFNLGNIYHMLDRHEEGAHCWEGAEGLCARLGDVSTVSSIKFNRAELYDEHGREREAFELYGQALDIRLEKKELETLPESILKWANSGLKCGTLTGENRIKAERLLAQLLTMDNAGSEEKEEAERILKELENRYDESPNAEQNGLR